MIAFVILVFDILFYAMEEDEEVYLEECDPEQPSISKVALRWPCKEVIKDLKSSPKKPKQKKAATEKKLKNAVVDKEKLVKQTKAFSKQVDLKSIQTSFAYACMSISKDLKERLGVEHNFKDVRFTPEVVARTAKIVQTVLESKWAPSLAAFSKHAKRAKITADDARLLFNKNYQLLAAIEEVSSEAIPTVLARRPSPVLLPNVDADISVVVENDLKEHESDDSFYRGDDIDVSVKENKNDKSEDDEILFKSYRDATDKQELQKSSKEFYSASFNQPRRPSPVLLPNMDADTSVVVENDLKEHESDDSFYRGDDIDVSVKEREKDKSEDDEILLESYRDATNKQEIQKTPKPFYSASFNQPPSSKLMQSDKKGNSQFRNKKSSGEPDIATPPKENKYENIKLDQSKEDPLNKRQWNPFKPAQKTPPTENFIEKQTMDSKKSLDTEMQLGYKSDDSLFNDDDDLF